MYHNFYTNTLAADSNWTNIILTAISALAAVSSAYFAFKSIEQNRISQIPILEPEILDVADPHRLIISIKNIGNGLAKKIKGKLLPLNLETSFGSDLLPRKYQDFTVLTWDIPLAFENGKNPLFQQGKLIITYQDIWGKNYSMEAVFKPDVVGARRLIGHIDKNFSGCFY